MGRLSLSLAAGAVALLAAGGARANSIMSDDCHWMMSAQSVFGRDEAVCVTGDVDYNCGAIGGEADIYAVVRGWSPFLDITWGGSNRIVSMMGAGAFISEPIWLPPLIPGVYDLVIDEHCDRVFGPHDLRVDSAFTVADVLTGASIDVAGIKLEAADEAARWRAMYDRWQLMTDILRLWRLANAAASAFTGDYSGIIAFAYGRLTGLPVSYNGAVLMIGGRIVERTTRAMERHCLDIVGDPPDPDFGELVTLDFSVIADELVDAALPGYPFAPMGSDPMEELYLGVASSLAEQAILGRAFVRALEKYQGAEEASSNEHVHRTARQVARLARELAVGTEGLEGAMTAMRERAASFSEASELLDPTELSGLQDRLRAEGLAAEEVVLLREYGATDEDLEAFVRFALERPVPTAPYSLLETLDDAMAGLATMRAAYLDVAEQADGVVEANAPYTFDLYPTADAGGPYRAVVGQPFVLTAAGSTDPDGDPLTYAWDLDVDGEHDDSTEREPSWTVTREGSFLVSVLVTDPMMHSDVAFARVVVEPGNLPPTVTGFTPEEIDLVVEVGQSLAFSVEAVDPEGDDVTVEWSLDGVVVGTEPSYELVGRAEHLGLHRVQVRLADDDPLSRDAYEQRQVRVVEAGAVDGDADGDVDGDGDGDGDGDADGDRGCGCRAAGAPPLGSAVRLLTGLLF